jgi:hypothetical protein
MLMKEAIDSLRDKSTGWVKVGETFLYAERSTTTGKLMIKTYSNRKQAESASKKQNDLGFDSFVSLKWPFKVCCRDVEKKF